MRSETQTSHVVEIFVCLTAEPGALERALQPFTISGFVPVRLSVRKNRPHCLFMKAQYIGIDIDRAINLAARLRAMPCARSVRISVRPGGRASHNAPNLRFGETQTSVSVTGNDVL
jgi:hypothetical protein